MCRSKWYSDIPIIPVKKKRGKRNTSEGILFFRKFPVERTVPFDFLEEGNELVDLTVHNSYCHF